MGALKRELPVPVCSKRPKRRVVSQGGYGCLVDWPDQRHAVLVSRRARAVIERMVPAQEVDDLVQEAVVRTLARAPDIPDDELLAYTNRTARNVVIDWYRQTERERRLAP